MKEKEKERVFVFFPPKEREWDEKHLPRIVIQNIWDTREWMGEGGGGM